MGCVVVWFEVLTMLLLAGDELKFIKDDGSPRTRASYSSCSYLICLCYQKT